MNDYPIQSLTNSLNRLNQRYAIEEASISSSKGGYEIGQPNQLKKSLEQLQKLFKSQQSSNFIPQQQECINALATLRRHPEQVDRKAWRLISWGLSTVCGQIGRPLDDKTLFKTIFTHFHQEIKAGILSKKCWFGLCYSYFSYPSETPQTNANWKQLQNLLAPGLKQLANRQRIEREWIKVVNKHIDLFSDTPGQKLAQAMFQNNATVLDEFYRFLFIPDSSWLWKTLIEAQLVFIKDEPDDDKFIQFIPNILALISKHERYADQILACALNRYYISKFKDIPEPNLKEIALDRWGSPQINLSRNRWGINVSDSVTRMVMRWFAKDDLEHFFKLLQNGNSVDQRRLDYWLRFVGQMGHTKIILGTAAADNRRTDFLEFKKKNHKRLGYLSSGNVDDNAFVMEINGYYFVEFSRTGNALYMYSSRNLPFNLTNKNFHLTNELKVRQSAYEFIGLSNHNTGNRLNHNSDWEEKADRVLRELRIYPDAPSSPSLVSLPEYNTEVYNYPDEITSEVESSQSRTPAQFQHGAINPAPKKGLSSAWKASHSAQEKSTAAFDKPPQDQTFVAVGLPEKNDTERTNSKPSWTSLTFLSEEERNEFAKCQMANLATRENRALAFWLMSLSKDPSIVVQKAAVAIWQYKEHCITITDCRAKGGALWINSDSHNVKFQTTLEQLGFLYVQGKGYYIK